MNLLINAFLLAETLVAFVNLFIIVFIILLFNNLFLIELGNFSLTHQQRNADG
jgi:hypothetical protein